MPQIANLSPAPGFLQYVVTQVLSGKDLRLGLIATDAQVASTLHLTNTPGVIAAEFNGAGWVRPTIQIPGLGAYNTIDNNWALPTAMEWSVTGPPGGIDVKQMFVIIDGSTTARSVTGTFLGLTTLTGTITIPAGITTAIKAPWSVLGVS
jgi:hypothetical protein